MKAICVCVGFDDLLAITLPRFCRAFEEVAVVSSFGDFETANVVVRNRQAFGNVRLFQTGAFYRGGATFNKGLVIEESFDAMGRDGWLAVVDADIVLPDHPIEWSDIRPWNLYVPPRRVLADPRKFRNPDLDWRRLPLVGDKEHGGWLQVFHADDHHIRDARPWYGTDWQHAGGCDSIFMAKWPPEHRVWLPWEVLHLGPVGQNWWGRATPRLDGREVPGAESAKKKMAAMMARRRMAKKGKERFAGEKVGAVGAAAPMPPPEMPAT